MPSSTPREPAHRHHRHRAAPIRNQSQSSRTASSRARRRRRRALHLLVRGRSAPQDAHQNAKAEDEKSGTPGGKALNDLLPGARWSAPIDGLAVQGRALCYVTFDGHRSNDDEPHRVVSEDFGKSWRDLRANLPPGAGAPRSFGGPLQENLLFLGTEFGAFVSIDRGKSWTKFNNNLPPWPCSSSRCTRPRRDRRREPTGGAVDHDITPLRQMSDKTAGQDFASSRRATPSIGGPEPRHGGDTRRFVGENDEDGAAIRTRSPSVARTISLQITRRGRRTSP